MRTGLRNRQIPDRGDVVESGGDQFGTTWIIERVHTFERGSPFVPLHWMPGRSAPLRAHPLFSSIVEHEFSAFPVSSQLSGAFAASVI